MLNMTFCNAQFNIPPWTRMHDKLLANPLGIPDNMTQHGGVEQPPHNFVILDQVGHPCKQCKVWIPREARPYTNGKEPVWWYWCDQCRYKFQKGAATAGGQRKTDTEFFGAKQS
jgi:hypothetical protein